MTTAFPIAHLTYRHASTSARLPAQVPLVRIVVTTPPDSPMAPYTLAPFGSGCGSASFRANVGIPYVVSDLDYLSDELRQLSASPRGIALPRVEVEEAIAALRAAGVDSIGWEGWLVWPDGRMIRSQEHQGTPSALDVEHVLASIADTQAAYDSVPEAPDACLHFWLWFRDPIPDVPPLRDRQGPGLHEVVRDAVAELLLASEQGVVVDRPYIDGLPNPVLWPEALERLTQGIHEQSGWQDRGAWLDGIYITNVNVDGDALVIEAVLYYVSGRDEWMKSPVRYELREPPAKCRIGYGGPELARMDDKAHLLKYPGRIDDWPWTDEFSLPLGEAEAERGSTEHG